MLLILVIALKNSFIKDDPQFDGYDRLTFEPASGNYDDSNYLSLHKIDNFDYETSGDFDRKPISNAFDNKDDTYWVSKDPETDSFHPYVTFNFKSQILFEGFVYKTAYHKLGDIYHFDGFPAKLKIYTATTEKDDFKLRAVFTGEQSSPSSKIQFILSNPILCTKLKLEFHQVSAASSFDLTTKNAAASGFVLYKNHGYDLLYHTGATGLYADSSYVNFHKIRNFDNSTNGDNDDHSFEFAIDSDVDSYWQSAQPESESFIPTIYINFTEPLMFEGLLYDVTKYQSSPGIWKHGGFPNELHIYTALGDEPFTKHSVFQGSQKDNRVQFILSKPTKCSRLKIELRQITNFNKVKYAAADQIIFLQSFDIDQINYQNLNGQYSEYSYVQFHTIKRDEFSIETNGDNPDYPIEKTLDPDLDSSWNSLYKESDKFKPTIYVNFTKPTPFQALIYNATHEGKTYYGFPGQLILYTALGDDEPFKARCVFQGSASANTLLLLPEAINCTRIKLVFYNVLEIKAGGNFASSNGFQFLRTYDYDQISSQKAEGQYTDSSFVDSHTIRRDSFKIITNGDNSQYPIENAVDGSGNDWNSIQEESDTFRPIIYVNFTEPTLFQGFLYDLVYYKPLTGSNTYYGFPSLVLLYTALGDDEPLTPKVIFRGEASDPKMLFCLSKPIECTRIQLELYYVSPIKDGNKKIASAKKLTFLHSYDYEQISYQKAGGEYENADYRNLYMIPVKNEDISDNGHREGKPISNVLDSSYNTNWISSGEESDTYRPTIFVDFKKPTLFHGLLYIATSEEPPLKDRQYYGLPKHILLYTANGDEEFTPKVLFHGTEIDPKLVLKLTTPINCTKIKLELSYMTALKEGGKYASADEIVFFQSYNHEKYRKADEKYSYIQFIESSQVLPKTYSSKSTQLNDHPLPNLFDSNDKTYWVSGQSNSNDFKESITVEFENPVFVEALIMAPRGKEKLWGFPLLMNVYASLNDGPLSLTTSFYEYPSNDWERIQFVFPKTIRCTKMQLEFAIVTQNNDYNNEQRVSLGALYFIAPENVIDFSNKDYIEELDSTINISDDFLWNEISNSSFIKSSLPNNEDYLFIVDHRKDEIRFYNDSFGNEHFKVGAIKSHKGSSVYIDKCIFTSCTVKSSDENGGALNFFNCPVQCERSEFDTCLSTTGGKGGAIYIAINDPINSNSLIEDCKFTKCSAAFGAGIYAYSNEADKEIVITDCTFVSNNLINDHRSASIEKPSGSAIYIKAVKSAIVSCKFKRNAGADSVKVVYNFAASNNKNALMLDEKNHVVVKSCSFEIDSSSKASISLLHESDSFVPISIDGCTFTGKLAKDAHHIDGNDIKNVRELNLLRINSCKFESGKKGALKLRNRLAYSSVSFDQMKQEFHLGTQKQSRRNSIGVHAAFALVGAAVVGTIVIALIATIQKRSDDNDEL